MHLGLGLSADMTHPARWRYLLEASSLFARFTTPATDARKAIDNAVFVSLKNAGLLTKLDWLSRSDAADSQVARLNWLASQTMTEVNAPSHTADRGYVSDGSTSYLTGPFSPAKFTVNSGFVGIGIQQSTPLSGGIEVILGNARIQLSGTTQMQARVNDGTGNAFAANGVGRYYANRSASNAREFYKDGVSAATDAVAATAIATGTFSLLSAFGGAFSTDRVSFLAFGSSLTPAEVAAFDAIMLARSTAVGS